MNCVVHSLKETSLCFTKEIEPCTAAASLRIQIPKLADQSSRRKTESFYILLFTVGLSILSFLKELNRKQLAASEATEVEEMVKVI